MIDIIVNVSEINDDFFKSLFSIGIQSIKDKINVILVYNSSLKIKGKIDKFEKLFKIDYIEYDGSLKKGEIYKLGFEKSKSDYFMFLDSPDVIYDYYSVESLYNNIVDSDLCYVTSENFYMNDESFVNSFNYIYSKLFSRKVIKDNKIKFIETDAYSDYFYVLACNLVCNNNVINSDIYVCKHDFFDNSFISIDYLEDYVFGVDYVASLLSTKSLNSQVSTLLFKNLNDIYLLYNDVDDLEVREDIIKKTLSIYRKYMEYNKYSDEENEKNIFNNNFYKNIPKVSFFEFLNLYKKYL